MFQPMSCSTITTEWYVVNKPLSPHLHSYRVILQFTRRRLQKSSNGWSLHYRQ